MPKLPKAPSIPKPFQRPGIEITGAVKRFWHETPIDRIRRGDIIRDFGAVGDTEILRTDRGEDLIFKATNELTGEVQRWNLKLDTSKIFEPDQRAMIPTLFAFSEG